MEECVRLGRALASLRTRMRAWGRVPVGLSGSVGPGWIVGNAAARKGAPGKHCGSSSLDGDLF